MDTSNEMSCEVNVSPDRDIFKREPSKPSKYRLAPGKRSMHKQVFLYASAIIASGLVVASSPLLLLVVIFHRIKKLFNMLVKFRKRKMTPKEVLGNMTLDEKVSMMSGSTTFSTGGCSRLGVPPLKFTDGPSGARGMATIPESILSFRPFAGIPWMERKLEFQDPNKNSRPWFIELGQRIIPDVLALGPGTFAICAPCGTCLAATFNKSLAFEIGQLIGRDTRSKGAHVILGPTLNLTRGPTGGRNFEGYGEDPYLSGIFGINWVQGAQSVKGVSACAKHFAGNELERFRFHVDCQINTRPLHELYIKNFKMVAPHVDAIMTGYNKLNGDYCCSNKILLKDILRDDWGFDGVVMSDWGGTHDVADSAGQGLLDLEMPGPPKCRGKHLKAAVLDGSVAEEDVDEHVLRMLNLTEKTRGPLGPGVGKTSHELEKPAANTTEDISLLRKVSRESVVLLKNKDDVLPIDNQENLKINLFGPNSVKYSPTGGGSVETMCITPETIEEALLKSFPGASISTYSGKYVGLETASLDHFTPFIVEVFESPKKMDDSSDALGKISLSEGRLLCFSLRQITWTVAKNLPFPGAEWDKAGVKITSTLKAQPGQSPRFGLHTFSLAASGPMRLSVDGRVILSTPSTYETDPNVLGWNLFSFGCKFVEATIELDECIDHEIVLEWAAHRAFVSPPFAKGHFPHIGKEACPFTYHLKYKSETISSQIQDSLRDAASKSDYNILVLGRQSYEETEFFDVESMNLQDGQLTILDTVAKAGKANDKKTVVLLNAGTPIEMASWESEVDAVLQIWFGGQQGPGALGDVLSGLCSPSGKLPFTVPRKYEDNPTYTREGERFPGLNPQLECKFDEGLDIGYRYYDKFPELEMFPFGFGLSYTAFDLNVKRISPVTYSLQSIENKKLSISVQVKNTGHLLGAEVIQVYVGAINPRLPRPIKELKAFEKVWIEAGETEEVKIDIDVREATEFFDDETGEWTAEAGSYKVYVGTSARDIIYTDSFTVSDRKSIPYSNI